MSEFIAIAECTNKSFRSLAFVGNLEIALRMLSHGEIENLYVLNLRTEIDIPLNADDWRMLDEILVHFYKAGQLNQQIREKELIDISFMKFDRIARETIQGFIDKHLAYYPDKKTAFIEYLKLANQKGFAQL